MQHILIDTYDRAVIEWPQTSAAAAIEDAATWPGQSASVGILSTPSTPWPRHMPALLIPTPPTTVVSAHVTNFGPAEAHVVAPEEPMHGVTPETVSLLKRCLTYISAVPHQALLQDQEGMALYEELCQWVKGLEESHRGICQGRTE